MDSPRFKPIELPRDARELMKLSPEVAAAVDEITQEAEHDGRWETAQDVPLDINNPEFLAYWIHKTVKPIVRAMPNSGVEERLQGFRQTRFDLLPAAFEVDAEVTLSASGDLMCTKGLAASRDRLYEDVAELIFGADIAYANLESTLTSGAIETLTLREGETPMINITPAEYETLVAHRGRHYDIVQLANNHILDCGEEGVSTTLTRLKRDGIAQVGVNDTAEAAAQPRITELHGLRIGWVAHTWFVNLKPFPEGKPWFVNLTPFHTESDPDISVIEGQIKACRAAGCDLVFAGLHWGLEFELYPHPDQLKWAHRFADAGADAVIGHHPHVAQPVEIYRPLSDPSRAVPILYSLGNLTPVLSSPATVLSLVARLRLVQGRLGTHRQTRVASLDLTPIAIMAQPEEGHDVLRLLRLYRLQDQTEDPQMGEYIAQMGSYADLLLGASWRDGSTIADYHTNDWRFFMLDTALAYVRRHQPQHLEALFEYLRIPSISTSAEHTPDMHRAAAWLSDTLRRIGFMQVAIMPTAGHPVVYGELLGAGPDAPTVLLYGHYDVQPVEPVSEWLSPPFEPSVRGDNLFCRGATDDKGQVYAVLAAADAYLRTAGKLPVNLKLMIEGEEEIASPNLAPWLREHRSMLACDAILICDTYILDVDLPMICYGTRGMAYMEIEVCGPSGDLHSGLFGGVVDNPFNVLVRLLAQLQDGETRKVLIPGFYDKVRPLGADEQRLLAEVPFGDAVVRKLTGVPQVAGETGYTTMERSCVRPTLDIHGMPGGFTEPGAKTVIPAKASAKVSMRLVPDQTPEEIAVLFERQIRALTPPTVTIEVRSLGLARPSIFDFRHPAIQSAAEAYKRTFGVEPVCQRGGGTLPILPDFQDILGAPVVLMGFGLPDDNPHSPNEKVHLPNLYRGMEAVIHYFFLLAEQAQLR